MLKDFVYAPAMAGEECWLSGDSVDGLSGETTNVEMSVGDPDGGRQYASCLTTAAPDRVTSVQDMLDGHIGEQLLQFLVTAFIDNVAGRRGDPSWARQQAETAVREGRLVEGTIDVDRETVASLTMSIPSDKRLSGLRRKSFGGYQAASGTAD